MHTDTAVVMESVPVTRAPARSYVLQWLAVLLPFLVVALWRLADGPGFDADDYGQYLMHARALVEGRPYTDIGYIHSHFSPWIGPLAAPPGLPLTLAAIYSLVGPDIALMRVVMLAFATAFVLLAALYFARHEDPRLGMGVGLLCGLSPGIAHASTQLLTDLPFAALVWAVIYLVDRRERFDLTAILAVTILGALAVLFRVTGAALFPAFLVYGAVHYRRQGVRPLLPLLIWTGGLLLLAVFTNIERSVVVRLRPLEMLGWIAETKFGLVNIQAYSHVLFESHLHPFPWPPLNDAFHVGTVALMALGLVVWLPKAWSRFGTIFGALYAAMLLLTPVNQPRYLWPLFPFFVFGLLNGIRFVAQRLAPGARWPASAVALAFAAVLAPLGVLRAIDAPRRGDLMEVPEVQQVARELQKAALVAPVRVTFYKPRSFAWATGIPAMGPIQGPQECLIAELARADITHVIVGSLGSRASGGLSRLAVARPDLFVRTFGTESFTAYRFREPAHVPRTSELPACQ